MTNTALKDKLAEKTQVPVKAHDPAKTVGAYLDKMQLQIAKALPKHMNADRLARIALTTIRTNPKLLECSIESLMGAGDAVRTIRTRTQHARSLLHYSLQK